MENRKRSRKKLVGPGVFSLEDLGRIREEKDRRTSKSIKRKKDIRALDRATNEDNSSTTRRVIDEEVGECIIVRPRIS